jgi:hypothetical protein
VLPSPHSGGGQLETHDTSSDHDHLLFILRLANVMVKFVIAEKPQKYISVVYFTTLPVAQNIKHLMVG